MSIFKEVFQNKHIILPVIHAENDEQIMTNARIAFEAGCDGTFLINMQDPETGSRMSHENLLKMQQLVRNEFATWWIGVNYLDLNTVKVFENVNSSVSGVWADSAEINEWATEQIEAEKIKLAKEKSGWGGLYFGGVAFKYQPNVDNPALAAKVATSFVDVVTTSGRATGSAPDISKIQLMKEAIEDFPLAIASGVSSENAKLFLPYTDCFIVATSILRANSEYFDKDKIKALTDIIRG